MNSVGGRMKIKSVLIALSFVTFVFSSPSFAKSFGQGLCKNHAKYDCYQVKQGDSWHSLFPDPNQRDIARKVNRMNTNIRPGMIIAIPRGLSHSNLLDYSPFPHNIAPPNRSVVKFDMSDLAWAAYTAQGKLLKWGPISGGKNYCANIGRACRTPYGSFSVYRIQGAGCKSSKYPLPRGGAPMPYCMHFKGGYAMHGSPTVPGYNASHGCVRMFTEDAKWLNHNFVKMGTKVLIVP